MDHFISKPGTFLTLGVALLFAAIYLFGGRASQVFGVAALRRFHSFAAGIAVSYVFLYVLPEFQTIREAHLESQNDYIQRVFPDYSVYLSALIGFLGFYGLENLLVGSRGRAAQRGEYPGATSQRRPWIHISGFAIYTWLITFQLGHSGEGGVSLGVFAVAMGLHLAPITNRLRSEYAEVYEYRGAILLALASLAGWACGLTLHLPGPLVLDMTAIVAGGVIVNTAITELPKERNASFWSLMWGAVTYSALLLALSRLEEGS